MIEPEVLRRITEERETRATAPGVVSTTILDEPIDRAWPLVAGTLLVMWSSKAQPLQSLAERVAAGGDGVQEVLEAPLELTDPPSMTEPGDPLDRVPAFCEIRYRGRLLVDAAMAPPGTIDVIEHMVIPWVGGSLDPASFTTVSWVLPGSAPVAVHVVANPPVADEDEARILAAIPPEFVELGIAPQATPAAAAAAAARWAAKEAAKAVAKAAVREAAQEAAERWNAHAARHEAQQARNQRLAEQRAAEAAFRDRTQWRNAGVLPDPQIISTEPPAAPPTIDQLVALRVAAMLERSDDADRR